MRKDVVVLNPKGYVAICTLWTKKEEVVSLIPPELREKVWGVGTLYSIYGINYLVHTLAENPTIEYLVLFGSDLGGSGRALTELFGGRPPQSLKLMWSVERVREAINGVTLMDLRREYEKGDCEALIKFLRGAERRGKRGAVKLEIKEAGIEGWPIPVSGTLIHEASLFAAWVKAIYAVLTYGYLKSSEYGERQKELLNLVIVLGLYGEGYELEEGFERYLPIEVFKRHLESLFEARRAEGVEYTYGERLLNHPLAGNQLERLVSRLKERPETRRAIAVLWYHSADAISENPPCIVLMQGEVTGEYYNHTVFIRSNDVYSGWPANAYGQVELAKHIASRLGLKVGVVTTISSSAHIYEHDWGRAFDVVRENEWVFRRFVPDPRGNFIFNGDVLEHRAPTGELVERLEISRFDDKARYAVLKRRAMLLLPPHAFWLGARAYSKTEL